MGGSRSLLLGVRSLLWVALKGKSQRKTDFPMLGGSETRHGCTQTGILGSLAAGRVVTEALLLKGKTKFNAPPSWEDSFLEGVLFGEVV